MQHDFQDGNGFVPAHRHVNADGEQGGWVADTAWVASTAYVHENAQVYENARVYENAQVYGNAWVYGNARVCGTALVYGNAWVYGNARVYGNAWVYGNARVCGTDHQTTNNSGEVQACATPRAGRPRMKKEKKVRKIDGTSMLNLFQMAKERAVIKQTMFPTKAEYIFARNRSSYDRRMAFTLASSLAFGPGGVSDQPSAELDAWMRIAEWECDPLVNVTGWRSVVEELAHYMRKMHQEWRSVRQGERDGADGSRGRAAEGGLGQGGAAVAGGAAPRAAVVACGGEAHPVPGGGGHPF